MLGKLWTCDEEKLNTNARKNTWF